MSQILWLKTNEKLILTRNLGGIEEKHSKIIEMRLSNLVG